MKTAIILLCLFISVAIVVTAIIEHRKEDSLDQATIEGLKRQNEKEKDSLNNQLATALDLLLLAQQTIILQADTLEANKKEKENYKRNTHDKIRFIPYANDSQRDSVLSGLYPSFRSFR